MNSAIGKKLITFACGSILLLSGTLVASAAPSPQDSTPTPIQVKIQVGQRITKPLTPTQSSWHISAVLPTHGDFVLSLDMPVNGSYSYSLTLTPGTPAAVGGGGGGGDPTAHVQNAFLFTDQPAQTVLDLSIRLDPSLKINDSFTFGLYTVKPLTLTTANAATPSAGVLTASVPFAEYTFPLNAGDAMALQLTDQHTGQLVTSLVAALQNYSCHAMQSLGDYRLDVQGGDDQRCHVLVSAAKTGPFTIEAFPYYPPSLDDGPQPVNLFPGNTVALLTFTQKAGETLHLSGKKHADAGSAINALSPDGQVVYLNLWQENPLPADLHSDVTGVGYVFITLQDQQSYSALQLALQHSAIDS